MKILVTGGAGFIGSHLTEHLLARGDSVDCLDNFNDYYEPRIKRLNLEQARQWDGFRLIEGDILDVALLKELFAKNGYTKVVHLAARAGVRPSIQDPLLYERVNVQGTLNLLEQCRLHNIDRFIVASSSSVYGNNKKVPFHEDDPVDNPISPYAATKKATELVSYTYHHLYQLSVTCLRFFTVYGPRQRPDMAIHKFTRLIHAGKPLPVFGTGQMRRDFTYVDDVIQGLVAAIDRCQGYRIYNLGESQTIDLLSLIHLLEKQLQKKANLDFQPEQPGDVAVTYADITRARDELDYHPQTPLEVGIIQFVNWFLQTLNR
ncbi:MAG TPA: GDP-mannose 4,6-dehydratase [bacterium]|jgi:UDP-glucuronate 4-epimerase|nr:GDP-mannose 4,6-dehydratase [bacterium]HNT65109.1 GDP-mannose 4,6-dehydratase [bacterium]HOX86363.1 GDP-mannose 4,6-dehydratase [bacterium]HPG45808.1 GDP-mannose 4,6-dehydratase [bacterium]HPM97965.1 GDP-mannose 4,6-dehydratase [bacterium]